MPDALTSGIDHVGLTVGTLPASVDFFVHGLGWSEKGGKPEYPAAFVSDGSTLITLWEVADPDRPGAFDRKANIGLHHLALRMDSSEALDAPSHASRTGPASRWSSRRSFQEKAPSGIS